MSAVRAAALRALTVAAAAVVAAALIFLGLLAFADTLNTGEPTPPGTTYITGDGDAVQVEP